MAFCTTVPASLFAVQPDPNLPQIIEAELIADLTRDPRVSTRIDGAILICGDRYFYQRTIRDEKGTRYEYKCLSPDSLAYAFANRPIDSGWMPPGIVRTGIFSKGSWAVYFIKPGKHKIYLEGQTIKVPLPGLVWFAIGNEYRLVATSSKKFDPEAPCFHAPLPNVYDTGKLCWGDNVPPYSMEAIAQSCVEGWKLFIGSPFNNHLANDKSRSHPTSIVSKLKNLQEARSYPMSDLIPLYNKVTVDQYLKALLNDNPNPRTN